MKKDLHPSSYRPVVFQATSNGFAFLTRSTAATQETIKWEDGNEYPLVKIHISSQSHPFFTGEEKIIDIEGRVDKFKARAEAAAKARDAKAKAAKKPVKKVASEEIKKDDSPVAATDEKVEAKSEETSSEEQKLQGLGDGYWVLGVEVRKLNM